MIRSGVFRRLERAVHRLSGLAGTVAGVAVALLMVSTSADVIRRLATGRAIPGVVEYSEWLLVGVAFFGLALALRDQVHVRMSLVTDALPHRIAAGIRVLGMTVVAGVIIWAVNVTGQRALASYHSSEYRFGLVQAPVWPARAFITIGLVLLLLELVVAVVHNARIALGMAAPPDPQEAPRVG